MLSQSLQTAAESARTLEAELADAKTALEPLRQEAAGLRSALTEQTQKVTLLDEELRKATTRLERAWARGEAFQADIAKLEAELKKLEAEGVNARPFCEINEGYDFAKLPPETQKRLVWVLEWLELYRKQVIDPLLDPARNERQWGGGGLHMYNLRQIHPYTVTYAVLLDVFGNREWHRELVRVAKAMLKLTTTEFRPGFDRKFADAEGKGVRRFIYQPHLLNPFDPASDKAAGLLRAGIFTDGHDLDKDLSDGTVVDLLAALHANREFDAETRGVVADLKDFAFGLFERRALYTRVFYPRLKGDPYFYSKPLNHPTVAFACAAGHMHRMFGGDDLKAAYERAKAELEADREYVQTPYGELYATPHGVQEGYKRDQRYRGVPEVGDHPVLQDMTYVGEAVAYFELANRARLAVAPDRMMAAIGRSLDLCVMYDGYGAKTIAGSIGGGGRPKEGYGSRKRQVNLRTGESYPCRWLEPEADFREGMHQLTRNLTTTPLSRVMTPEIEAGLRVTLRNAEKEGYERYGARVPLLLAVAERL